MQITIDHGEIVESIRDFISKQGIAITDKELNVSMTAGRGGNGYSATVEITAPSNDTSEESTSTQDTQHMLQEEEADVLFPSL